MMNMIKYAFTSVLFAAAFLLSSCNVHYDLVSFHPVGSKPAIKTPVPSVQIDTNIPKKIFGGSMRSKKPYDIQVSYSDSSLTIASAEFTKVMVAYADGTVDPGVFKLKLPMKVQQHYLEDFRFDSDAVETITKERIIYAEFPKTISRDEGFTLLIEGTFTKDDGSIIPFKFQQKCDISRESGNQSWVDFVSGC